MGSATRDSDRIVGAWAEQDEARALHPVDRDVIRQAEPARSLVLELFIAPASGPNAHARDLFNACARLGDLMAQAGASPTLAAGTIDTAVQALADAGKTCDPSHVAAARASLVEGYVAGVRDAERKAALLAWEYPTCIVPIEQGARAIACSYPSDDREAISEWAARIASRLVKEKVRWVVLSGTDIARSEMASAVNLVGIEVRTEAPPASARPWLRLPWRK